MAGRSLTVDVLGPVRAVVDGRVVDTGGPKQAAVLAVLALAAGREVPAAELSAALWGDRPPATATGTLRAYVSRLRSALPDGSLTRGSAGWRLDVDRAAVDALRVTDLVSAGLAGAADGRTVLTEALAAWYGTPLAGLDGLPFAAAEQARLGELQAAAQDRLLELRLADGEAREVLADATALVGRHPYRESSVALLAVALARSGRQADALDAIELLRRRLADDLGLDLSPPLRDLQHRLLVHDPSLLRAGSVPASPERGPRRRLPLPLTSFVGREDDVAAVEAALDTARLVTLTGPGGAGKTRLAMETARRNEGRHPDGVHLVELGGVARPEQVLSVVAQALEIVVPPDAGAEALVEAVGDRRALLVVDNCEHLVDEVAGLVARLLGRCGGLQVLATSREALAVPGERAVVVAPLPCGDARFPGSAERLFAERAAVAVPGFRLDPTTAGRVSQVVRALDGIPLAVELAASRLSVMGLDDLLTALSDRFPLLEGGSRTALPHQRTLAAAVQWSWDLLDDDERLVLALAATRAADFHLEALDHLARPELGRPVLPVLASLVNKSMVQVDSGPTSPDRRTYRLLETVRAFARERTDEALAARAAERQTDWFAARADAAYRDLRGPDLGEWLAWCDVVQPDLRAVLGRCVEEDDRARAVRLVAGTAPYWFHRGHVQEAAGWLDAVRALPGRADEVDEARATLGAALLGYLAGDAPGTGMTTLEDLRHASAVDDPTTALLASVYACYAEAAFGDLSAAIEHFARVEALLAAGSAEPWAQAEALFAKGQVLRAQALPGDALAALAEAARAADACGHAWARCSARYIAAKIHVDLRQGGPALLALARELPASHELAIHTTTLALLHVAAAAAALVERHEDGAVLLGAVERWGERLGWSPVVMDPVDTAEQQRLVHEGLVEADREAARARGRRLTLPQAIALVASLAGAVATRSVPRPGERRRAGLGIAQ